MESQRNTKKRIALGSIDQAAKSSFNKCSTEGRDKSSQCLNCPQNSKQSCQNDLSLTERNVNNSLTDKHFHPWKFGTINIRSGKEKFEGAKIYAITKEVAKTNLDFCCLQEVRYRGTGRNIIELDSGQKYEFLWCGQNKRRDKGVGFFDKTGQTNQL
jgi:hypothetical protein